MQDAGRTSSLSWGRGVQAGVGQGCCELGEWGEGCDTMTFHVSRVLGCISGLQYKRVLIDITNYHYPQLPVSRGFYLTGWANQILFDQSEQSICLLRRTANLPAMSTLNRRKWRGQDFLPSLCALVVRGSGPPVKRYPAPRWPRPNAQNL